MKHISLRQGKDELISTCGNHLCGLPVRITLSPEPGDNTRRIQAALNEVGPRNRMKMACGARSF